MNERIKELVKQAGFITTPNTDVIKNNHWGGYMDGQQFEKFAELIVEVCLNKIENEAAQYAEPVWAVELVNDIKEHFGVSE